MSAPMTHSRGSLLMTIGMAGLLIVSLLASFSRPHQKSGGLKVLCSFLPVYVFATPPACRSNCCSRRTWAAPMITPSARPT